MNQSICTKKIKLKAVAFASSFLFWVIGAFAQLEVPPVYSPDGNVNAIVAKGDTLIVAGNFNHVGKHTGGGALFPTNSDQPILAFPKILGTVISSTPDGNGGFYIFGNYKLETENTWYTSLRIEHIFNNNTFDTGFSLSVNAIWARGKILFHNGILYFGGEGVSQIAGQNCGDLAAINVSTKLLLPWIPTVSTFNFSGVTGVYAKGNILYIIGNFREVGGVQRNSAAAIEIGTGAIKNWNPTPNWDRFYGYSDLLFYGDKIIIGGTFDEGGSPNGLKHACAIVDETTGQNFTYIFQSGGLFGNGVSFLYHGAGVSSLAIKGDILFAYSRGTFDTRVTAVNLADSNRTIWAKYFNMIANATKMEVVGNSLVLVGSNFDSTYVTNLPNEMSNTERGVKGAIKLNLATGNLEAWYPDPVGWNVRTVNTMTVSGGNIFIGGNFSHVNGIDRVGVYMVNAQTDVVLPLKMEVGYGYPITTVNSLKLMNDTLYVGGNIRTSFSVTNSVVAFNINTNTRLGWTPAYLSTAYALEANDKYVFVGGTLNEPSGGAGRTNLFAIDKQTGQLASWAPNPLSAVYSLKLWKEKLYVGGDFRTISGQPRNRLASFDAASLAISALAPNINSTIAVTSPIDNTIWVGGSFSMAGDSVRNMLAGIQPESGSIRPSPYLNSGNVRAIQTKGCTIFSGGEFRIGGATTWNDLVLFDIFNKTTLPGNVFLQDESGFDGIITSLAVVGNDVFFGGRITKVNGKANATGIGRVRFPASFFEGCEEYISVQNGNWNNPATWEKNEVPPTSARVTVRHQIQVTQNASCLSVNVAPSGNVNVTNGVELRVLNIF